jgi:type I restriction enzyme, S subunit
MKWPKACLGDLAQVVSGATPKSSVDHYWAGDIPWITPADLSKLEGKEVSATSRRITQAGLSSCSSRILPPRSVLLSSRAPIGHVAINTVPMATNQGFKSFVPDQEILSSDFLYWWLKSNKEYLQSLGRGATFKEVSKEIVESIEIPLPPLEEQRRIAAILDRAGNLGQHAKGQLFIAKNLLASLFVETIGDPLNPPHDWTTLPLAEAVQAGTDVTYGIVQAGEEYPGGVPYIRTGDIVDGEIDVSALRHTNPAIARRFTRSMVRAGEIVMSIRATVGTTAVVPVCLDGANLTQGTARVAPGENVNGVYLLQYLRMPSTQAWIQRQVKGATFREITLARLRELPVLIPPMAIQDEFAVKAKIANSVIGSSKVLLGRIENLSQSLGNQLLGRKY